MSLLSNLRKRQSERFATATPATVATLEDDRVLTVASVATVSVANPPEARSATASRWWLIHDPDRESVEVASFPPVTHAEILERHLDDIAVEPTNQSKPETAHMSCINCAHLTGRGGCGEPVAAGLSDVVGVIVYHDAGGKDCPAWLATLQPDLEVRILAMAARWHYSGDDLAAVFAGARADPEGWRKVVETDEQIRGGIDG